MWYSGQKLPVTLGHKILWWNCRSRKWCDSCQSWRSCHYRTNSCRAQLNWWLQPRSKLEPWSRCRWWFYKYCVLDGDLVHVIPDSLSCEQAALTEPAILLRMQFVNLHWKLEIQLLSLAWVQLVFWSLKPFVQQEHQKSMRLNCLLNAKRKQKNWEQSLCAQKKEKRSSKPSIV